MVTFKQFIKKNNLRLIFFVLLGLFISENGFAPLNWPRDLVAVDLVTNKNSILISIGVYDYSWGPNPVHAYLLGCKFEASVDNVNYFRFMEIETRKQMKCIKTKVIFKNKKENANIVFLNNYLVAEYGLTWPESLKNCFSISFPNFNNCCVVGLQWCLKSEFRNVRYIRISGIWFEDDRKLQKINYTVYNLNDFSQNALKSNTPDITTKESEKRINILTDSEAIVIKGADPGANIKVYSNSGVQIKSVISDNDVVKIKLPSKQIYIVHIGASRYKVAL